MRAARKLSEGNIYHVIQRGTGRQLIFEDDEDRDLFIRLLRKSLEGNSVEAYCWCLMGNHFHLLLHGEIGNISLAMKQCCGQYASKFNARHGRVGHLFQERYKSEPIDTDEYLLTVVRYIHQNPESAGICATSEWRWSSYREYTGQAAIKLCETGFVLACFGGEASFVQSHGVRCKPEECMDVFAPRSRTRPISDESAMAAVDCLLGKGALPQLKSFDKERRDSAIRVLLEAGLSIRQIERLTGIGRGIVARAKCDK